MDKWLESKIPKQRRATEDQLTKVKQDEGKRSDSGKGTDASGGVLNGFSPFAATMFWLGCAKLILSTLLIYLGGYFWSVDIGDGERIINYAAMFRLAASLFTGVSLMIFSVLYDIRVCIGKSTKS